MNMKTAGIVLLMVGLMFAIIQIKNEVVSRYNYEKNYSQLWELANKSSTIPAKQKYITDFLASLKKGKENGQFADNDALFLKTPNNSFSANLTALQTLSERLIQIQNMNPSSFEYNTAIQQITAQEQGEAHEMLSVFKGCYMLNNYFFVWGWVGIVMWLFIILIFIVGLITLVIGFDINI